MNVGDDDPDPSSGGPPHPMDRIWRHPSELPALSESAPRPRHLGAARVRSVLGPLGAGAIGALVTVGVLAAAGVLDRGTATSTTKPPTGTHSAAGVIASITQRAAPAIVAVRVTGKSGAGAGAGSRAWSRTGSGVCVRHAGQVLTSDRLVADATHIDIVTTDGKVETATVIGRDAPSDLALLAISDDLAAADLSSGSLHVGDPVYAVGADSTGAPWVSEGIVSSLAGRVASDGTTMSGLIESNAVTEPSVSGGALLDAEGRVAGILMTPVDGHPAAVAVPIGFAGEVADGLRADGHVDHGWLGLAGKSTASGRVVITALAEGGPSEKAGIQVGDVIVDADELPVATMDDLMATARGKWPGQRIRLVVSHANSERTVSVRLARMPRTVVTAPTTTTTTVPTAPAATTTTS